MSIWQKPPQYCKVISFQLKWGGRREEGSGWDITPNKKLYIC